MKKHLLILFAALLPLVASAQTKVQIDGIWYNLNAETLQAEVTSSRGTRYSGSITLPATVTYKGVDYSVTSIGDDAFYWCSSLTDITIPESVTSIGECAFYDCTRLTAINIPEGSQLTSIGKSAFYNCSSLTSITIPEGVTSIGSSAFYNCSSLKTVINYSDLPLQKGSSGHGYVGYYANKVANVDEFIGDYAFKTVDGVHYLTCYMGDETELTLPSDYQGENYQIGSYAFSDCTSLTTITIPEGVTSIGDYAFWICGSLTSITIPESVTSIGNHAFLRCSSLTSITIPESVTSIGGDAFSGCISLTSITIPEGVTSIGSSPFYFCSSLTSIVVAEGNKFYDSREGCNAIIETSSNTLIAGCSTTIIPEGVTSIGYGAFGNCSFIAITIPEGVTSIGEDAFYNCNNLTDITLPEGVTSIGMYAFSGCTSLTSITIPESVTSIGKKAFQSCSSLTAINIPENSKLTSIGDDTFAFCRSLTSITIPEGVTSIGDWAFGWCESLTDVYCYAEGVPTTDTDAFNYSNIKNVTLHVPASALESYKTTEPWSGFGNIVALTDEEMSVEQSVIEEQHELHDLQGHRVTHPTKGIYIINGRKVIIK